jgi:uncharacterized membrane protein
MFRLSLNPVFDSYLLVAVVALLLIGLAWWASAGRIIGGRRAALVALRLGVILLLILAMLRPTLVYTRTTKQAATLVVLADQSRSMTVPDELGNQTRWQSLGATLDKSAEELEKLSRQFELKAYGFDAELHELPVERGRIVLPEKPVGEQTAIGAALEDVLRREAGKRLLGVVLLSDGAQRAVAPRDLPPQTAAVRMRRAGCRLFAVPFGQSRGRGEARDVAVKELLVDPSVFVKNELSIGGQVRVDGYANVEIPVEALFETSPGKMQVVAQGRVKATADGQLLAIRLGYVPQVPGEFKLTLRAVEQPGELIVTNNELSTFVNVLKGGLNVLYIEGGLRIEQRFLRRALDSSPEMKVDYVRLDPRRPQDRPPDMAERFKAGKYDVYILGDVDSTAFEDGELAKLTECIGRGSGLLALGGRQSFGPGGYGATPLASVLPLGMDRLERQQLDEPMRSDLHWPGPLRMQPTVLGLRHFALTLAGSRAENEALWAKLPPLDGANKLHDLAPGAVVLAEAGPDRPLLVAHNFGEGRVLAFAGDSTWRWAMHGFDAAHKRFWRQIVLWLAHKDQSREGSVWVLPAKRRFAPFERVEFAAGANSPDDEPIAGADFQAEVVMPDGTRRRVALARQGDSVTGAFREANQPGDYAIEITATHKGQALGTARARFLVFRQDLELDNASADAGLLASLAAATNGKSIPGEELPTLVRQLAEDTAHLEVQEQTKKTFWDTWTMLLVLVGLLTVEWYLRKRWGLV